MSRIQIPLRYCKSRVPLVVFRALDGKPRVGIVDTGSEVTMIDPSLIGNGMEVVEGGGNTSFVGVNGEGGANTVSRVAGSISVKSVDGGDYDIPMSGVAYDCSNLSRIFSERLGRDVTVSSIIGVDFLKPAHATIDLGEQALTIDRQSLERI